MNKNQQSNKAFLIQTNKKWLKSGGVSFLTKNIVFGSCDDFI